MHIKQFMKRGHEFEREEGGECGRLWREERGKKIIKFTI